MLHIEIKQFQELNTLELYEILQLRSAIFVVEQDCVYQDVDGKDKKALHILGTLEGKLVAYTRIFKSGDYFEECSIGRVAVHQNYRMYGYGKDIMKASINAIKDNLNETSIKISAQQYLVNFYTSLGFKTIGEGYLEDDIPHIAMIKN